MEAGASAVGKLLGHWPLPFFVGAAMLVVISGSLVPDPCELSEFLEQGRSQNPDG